MFLGYWESIFYETVPKSSATWILRILDSGTRFFNYIVTLTCPDGDTAYNCQLT